MAYFLFSINDNLKISGIQRRFFKRYQPKDIYKSDDALWKNNTTILINSKFTNLHKRYCIIYIEKGKRKFIFKYNKSSCSLSQILGKSENI